MNMIYSLDEPFAMAKFIIHLSPNRGLFPGNMELPGIFQTCYSQKIIAIHVVFGVNY